MCRGLGGEGGVGQYRSLLIPINASFIPTSSLATYGAVMPAIMRRNQQLVQLLLVSFSKQNDLFKIS